MNRATIPLTLDTAIGAAINQATGKGLNGLLPGPLPQSANGLPLFIKYTSAKFGGTYAPVGPNAAAPKPGLHVSAAEGFTWGTACYVAPLVFPVSTAIYGRCGIVAEADPSNWRIFDASDAYSQQLYVNWVNLQPYAHKLILTTHSQLANQFLRNLFRTQYKIDCVVFPPDEDNLHYTLPMQDLWLAVTQWSVNGEISSGPSTVFRNPRLSVVLAEEFERSMGHPTLIGPTVLPLNRTQAAVSIVHAYNTAQISTMTA
jgi:hypothetical protein